ncbi:aminoacyl-histidine dipeptidase [Rurimicrobium arvi]|uniref:Aminoacyl-histidine dipeptidase n=1 Tax=Rurimicrobium arvi TaxID=2049916 RepID=A0ABP8MMS5_9BACT
MSRVLSGLQPVALWQHFEELNAVPRASKKEERVIAFIRSFAEGLGLDHTVDKVGNVIVRKPATAGMEDRKTVVLQSHLDMVHQQNAGTNFNFDTQGIQMYVDGDWVKAKGTTLGADNGIGVAAIMSILAATDIPHPPLEALFTIDEETGMTGALGLEGGLLKGSILLNLDTEEDTELTIGCAGGLDITAKATYTAVPVSGSDALQISVKGLTGGHSGGDIHLGRGNANKIMNRVLYEMAKSNELEIASIDGGSLRNAIPRESAAVIVCKDAAAFTEAFNLIAAQIRNEYLHTDPAISITATMTEKPASVLPADFARLLLQGIYACPNGIYRMSPDIPGLVQSSNNVARVLVKDGQCSIQCLTRSSVNSEKQDLANAIFAALGISGASITADNGYPGWEPRPGSEIVSLMSSLYEELFGGKAHVNAVHAGLECGILGTNYPDMQMISFGPNITGAHSPDERVQISSVQKFWKYFLETLKRIPKQ